MDEARSRSRVRGLSSAATSLSGFDRATELHLESFGRPHVPRAAELVAARFRRARVENPVLPFRNADPAAHTATLEALADRGSGSAALRDGVLVGFHAGWSFERAGESSRHCPDTGHAVDRLEAREGVALDEALYAHAAARWVGEGSFVHLVTVLTHEAAARESFVRLGFGMHVVDLVRDLSPLSARTGPSISLRRAAPADGRRVKELEDGLRQHLAMAPIFLPSRERTVDEHQRRLADDATATFLATAGTDRVVAYLRIEPCASDVATIVRDPTTASITGAFTERDRRGEEIATALLAKALAWARNAGYERCAVDHEAANAEASRFWARHFTPAAYSLLRRLPPGAVPQS